MTVFLSDEMSERYSLSGHRLKLNNPNILIGLVPTLGLKVRYVQKIRRNIFSIGIRGSGVRRHGSAHEYLHR